jgi:hypothetical protein
MVDLLFFFGSIFLIAAIFTRLVFGRERRAAYAEPDPEAMTWKVGKP